MTEGMATARPRDFWLPGLVGLVGTLASLAVWGLLVADRRGQVLASADAIAAGTRKAVEVGFAHQLEALHGLQYLWRTFGLRPRDEWKADVGERMDLVPGLASVAWVDLDEARSRIAVARDPAVPVADVGVEEVRRYRAASHIEGPERDASGTVRYRIFLPVRTPEDHSGVLVGQFLAAPFLERALSARAPGYALSVLWQGEEIFSRGTPTSDAWQQWWRAEGTVELPFGEQWRVVLRPTPELAAQILTPLPHYLLAAGILLSIVLAVLVHQLRVVALQSRFLAASNHALEERGAELESRVAERTEALEDAISELEAFNYSVSHDLRSPLGAILNFTSILEEDYRDRPLDADALGILERIRHSASRATALLEDLLQLSRAGRAPLHLDRVDVAALARETFAQVRAAEQDADVELVIESLPDAAADRALLADVFANLFSNALKYSRGCEKRRITVSGRADGAECVYEVTDNGHGFDMRFADKLFGLFERLHTQDVEGTGVGLAMVGRIVKRHGGRVWAYGTPGEGARFSFTLPAPVSS